MTISPPKTKLETQVFYPEADGKPVAESDITREYLLNTVPQLLGMSLTVGQVATALSLSVEEVMAHLERG